jgi:organic radical activating enzyme
MLTRISGLVVIPGYACNFFCPHCSVYGRKKSPLSNEEIQLIAGTIQRHGIKSLFFSGGEPSLYISEINRILDLVVGSKELTVTITTNGSFASDPVKAFETLGSFQKLSSIQLSYDKFHQKYLPDHNIANLYAACRKLKKRFSVVLTIETPLDLQLIQFLRQRGDFPIAVQTVLPVGAARMNRIEYKYPVFDRKVLSRRCVVKEKLSYVAGYGFTSCCLAPELPVSRFKYFHPTIEEHMASEFFRLITGHTLKGMMRELGVVDIDFAPKHSFPCMLCAEIFSRIE